MITEVIYVLNELDILEAHLEQHRPWGWRTVIVESERSHGGVPKPLFFHENRKRFEKFDVEHIVQPTELFEIVSGENQYKKYRNNDWNRRKWMQANFDAKNPWIFHADVDEILAAPPEDFEDYTYVGFRLHQFQHHVNRRTEKNEKVWRMTRSNVTVEMLPKVKAHRRKLINFGGWHFTNCPSSPEEARLKAQCRPWHSGVLHPNDIPGIEHYAAMMESSVPMNVVAGSPLGTNWVVPISDLPPWMQNHLEQFPVAVE